MLYTFWAGALISFQESFRTQESVLSLRRVILGLQSGLVILLLSWIWLYSLFDIHISLSSHEKQIGKYWLKSARIARRLDFLITSHLHVRSWHLIAFRAGHLQAAQSFLLNGRDYCPQEYCMENAEHMKAKVNIVRSHLPMEPLDVKADWSTLWQRASK